MNEKKQQETINTYKIEKMSFPDIYGYEYNVQRWTSIDGGKSFWYCGFGRFCRDLDEAEAYIEKDTAESGVKTIYPL